MEAPIFIPPSIRRTRKCDRCGLLYPKKETQCTHCADLTDREVEEFKLRIKAEHEGNSNLGKLFFYIVMLIAIGMAILLI